MKAKEFIQTYIENTLDEHGNQIYQTIEELFSEIGYDYNYKEDEGDSRWWRNIFCVQEINGRLIGYDWAEANRDEGIFDLGWDFDEDSICFVEKTTKTIECYSKIDE